MAALPVAVLVSGCAAGGSVPERSAPLPSLSASPPTAPSALPTGPGEIAAWADVALPEDRAGGSSALVRGSGRIATGEVELTTATEGGLWVALVACVSEEGSAMALRVESPSEPEATAVDVPCASPGDPPPPATRVTFRGDPEIALRFAAPAGTVYAYEIRSRGAATD
jgi:hypothetical protein